MVATLPRFACARASLAVGLLLLVAFLATASRCEAGPYTGGPLAMFAFAAMVFGPPLLVVGGIAILIKRAIVSDRPEVKVGWWRYAVLLVIECACLVLLGYVGSYAWEDSRRVAVPGDQRLVLLGGGATGRGSTAIGGVGASIVGVASGPGAAVGGAVAAAVEATNHWAAATGGLRARFDDHPGSVTTKVGAGKIESRRAPLVPPASVAGAIDQVETEVMPNRGGGAADRVSERQAPPDQFVSPNSPGQGSGGAAGNMADRAAPSRIAPQPPGSGGLQYKPPRPRRPTWQGNPPFQPNVVQKPTTPPKPPPRPAERIMKTVLRIDVLALVFLDFLAHLLLLFPGPGDWQNPRLWVAAAGCTIVFPTLIGILVFGWSLFKGGIY